MKQFIRTLIVLLALAEIIAWTFFVMKLAHWRGPMAGAGDGAGTERTSDLPSVLLAGVIWLLLTSPYFCMMLGSLNLIAGKSLRVAYYLYSLFALSIMTLILALSFQRTFGLLALGNIVVGGLWVYGFQQKTIAKEKSDTPN